MDQTLIEKVEEAYNLIIRANHEVYRLWIDHMIFTWRWWVLLILAVVPWCLWIKYRKKESSDRLLYSGFFVLIISSWFDFLGVGYGLWFYPYKLIPTIPAFIVWDFCLMPVTVMFMLQIKPYVKPYKKAILFAGMTAFVVEPLLEWADLYVARKWEHIYSFFIQFGIYLIAHYISRRNKFDEIL